MSKEIQSNAEHDYLRKRLFGIGRKVNSFKEKPMSNLRQALKAMRFKGDADYCTHDGDTIKLGNKAIEQILDALQQSLPKKKEEWSKRWEYEGYTFGEWEDKMSYNSALTEVNNIIEESRK